MFSGVHTAIITPFSGSAIDLSAIDRMVEEQVEAGIDGLVACGTTGESATLSDDEIVAVVERTVNAVAGRCVVTAGVGTNNTARTIHLTRRALEVGADAGLVIAPYYNKPTQEGLIAHCEAVTNAVPELPLMLYNVPSRTGISFSIQTLRHLSKRPSIVAVKEASADLGFATKLIAECGHALEVLSGDDITALPLWSVGGKGVVSVASNLVPARIKALWDAYRVGDMTGAQRQHLALHSLFDGLFIETNPSPIKALMHLYGGVGDGAVRLPLTAIAESSLDALKAICEQLEIQRK